MKKKSISIQLMGGFGNQMFQLSKALSMIEENTTIYLYQRDSNSEVNLIIDNLRILGIDIVHVDREKVNFAGLADRCVGLLLALELGNRKIWAPRVSRVALKALASCVFKTVFPIKRINIVRELGLSGIDTVRQEDFLVGYFQTFITTSDPFVLNSLKNCICKQEPHVVEEKVRKLMKRKLVIHIRLGDYLKERKFGILGVNYYLSGIDVFQSEGIQSALIFSDDIKMAKKIYAKSIESRLREVFGRKFEVSWIQSVNDSTLETFNLMRTGTHFIIANSSYSWWAARLSKMADSKVIAPDPWFQGMESPFNLCPPEWTTLNPRFED